MKTMVKKPMSDESGATAIEYALIAALIAVSGITAMKSLSSKMNGAFGNVADNL